MTNNGYSSKKIEEKAQKRKVAAEEYAAYVELHQQTKNARRKDYRRKLRGEK